MVNTTETDKETPPSSTEESDYRADVEPISLGRIVSLRF